MVSSIVMKKSVTFSQLTTFLNYHSVVSAIPKAWKCILHQNIPGEIDEHFTWLSTFTETKRGTPWAYNLIRKYDTNAIDTTRTYWCLKLNVNIEQEEWQQIRSHSYYAITISVRLRDFQYRVLSNRLVTNKDRNIWDKNISDKCTFCKNYVETTLHILYECQHTRKLWSACEKWFKYCRRKYYT